MNKKKGFTLLELLVVIAIIGILAAIGLGSYQTSRKRSADARRQGDLRQIQNAFEQYYSVNSSYPVNGTIAKGLFSDATLPTQPDADSTPYTIGYDDPDGDDYYACAQLEQVIGNCDSTPTDGCPADCDVYATCSYFCVWSLQ